MSAGKIKSYNVVRAAIFGKKPTAIQRIISLRSKLQVHSEYQFSERYDFVSFSATMQDDVKCARFKQIAYSHERERWDTVLVSMTDEEEDLAFLEAQILEGMPYDLKGQLCHLTKFRIWKPSKKKIWCSKAVARVIYKGRPDFFSFLDRFKLTDELRPDQLDMMSRYYFGKNLTNE